MKPIQKPPIAFTLVELIVVISIVCILALLGTAGFQGARKKAKEAECVGNLRSIGIALTAYASDHDGALPPSAMLPSGSRYPYRRQTYWFDALNPYMGYPEYAADREEDFPPPSQVVEGYPLKWQLCPAKNVTPTQRQTVGYGWNAVHFGWDFGRPGTGLSRYLTRIPDPANTILVGDSKDAEVRVENQFEHRYIYDYQREKNVPYPERHSGGGNYLFADGHVANLKPQLLKTIEGIRLFRHDK